MNGLLSGFVGAFVEASAELRIHKTRVLLSLIGVAIAVAAITAVVGVASIAEQAQRESLEGQGRPATFGVSAYSESGVVDPLLVETAFTGAMERYKITYFSRVGYAEGFIQFPDGMTSYYGNTSDVAYGPMHRVKVAQGRWFTERDEDRLAPAVVVNRNLWERMGSPDLATNPTLEFVGEPNTIAVVIGVLPGKNREGDSPEVRMLHSAWERITPPEIQAQYQTSYEMWVPPEIADELGELVKSDIARSMGEGAAVDVYRTDFQGQMEEGYDPLLPMKMVVGGIAGLVLFLGALSLVNISMVTLKQRIREIGIRRSFGATSGRVFFSVMMESVVGTFAAGVVGVMIAVAIVSNEWIQGQVAPGIQDLPPFPVDAAILGLVCATSVGALAGLLPALIAVRVKVIDAIRY